MKSNKEILSIEEIDKDFCDFIDNCGNFGFFTRSIMLQKEKILECEEYLTYIKGFKSQAIEREDEHTANKLFHIQCFINSMRSFLLMLITLKEDKFVTSWCHLVDSQDYVSIALKIKDYEGIRIFENRLKGAEESLFPRWKIYSSPGFVETIGTCSVCAEPFSKCEHLENNVYMGRLCQRVNRDIVRIDHLALVENPRDKRCIVTKISDDDGNELDYLTWEKTGKKVDNSEGKHFGTITYHIPTLDIF